MATRKRVTIWTRCKHEHIKQHKHSFTDFVRVIPSKRANETVRVRWDVVVLSVLGDRRGTDVLKALVGPDSV